VAVPVVAARAAMALLVDDLEAWVVRLALVVLVLVALPITAATLGFGGLLAIFGTLVPHAAAPALPGQIVESNLPPVAPDVVHLGASGGRLIDGWVNRAALNQYDQRNYRSASSWLAWRNADCSAAALDWLLGAYGRPAAAIDDAIALIGPNDGISTALGLLDARGSGLASALARSGLQPRQPRDAAGRLRPITSAKELQAWLDQGPLLMGGDRWFGEGHWFVGIGYDQNGVYIRDSSGWDTRYLTWSRLYSEVGFDGWVVGVAP
jgi:hypothetical protein